MYTIYMKKNVILIGAGGHAKSIIDSIDKNEYNIVGFIDDIKKRGSKHLEYPILSNSIEEIKNPELYCFFISIGNNYCRKKWFDSLKKYDLNLINVIDRSAIVSENASIGEGCFIGKMAIVNSMSKIGDNCIINTKALVEHGCFIDDHVTISTNAVVNGDVHVGEGSTIYSSSVVIGQKSIGKWSIIGAGSVVINDIPDSVVAVGVPSKIIKNAKYDK